MPQPPPAAAAAAPLCAPGLQCIVSAAGKNFCGGLDLSYLNNTFGAKMQDPKACPARLRDGFRQEILQMQVGAQRG